MSADDWINDTLQPRDVPLSPIRHEPSERSNPQGFGSIFSKPNDVELTEATFHSARVKTATKTKTKSYPTHVGARIHTIHDPPASPKPKTDYPAHVGDRIHSIHRPSPSASAPAKSTSTRAGAGASATWPPLSEPDLGSVSALIAERARLELADPNPDLHKLFRQYDTQLFDSRLMTCGVRVNWSTAQMTSCGGVCKLTKDGIEIRLSKPLLALRSRTCLVHTLLHEMIHAHNFIVNVPEPQQQGHGPAFLALMHRINRLIGVDITVCHSWLAEVQSYKVFEFQCDGPCRHRPPFHGLYSASKNRPPDVHMNAWFEDHQRSCGGTYRLVKWPDDYDPATRRRINKKGLVTADSTAQPGKASSVAGPKRRVKRSKHTAMPGKGYRLDDDSGDDLRGDYESAESKGVYDRISQSNSNSNSNSNSYSNAGSKRHKSNSDQLPDMRIPAFFARSNASNSKSIHTKTEPDSRSVQSSGKADNDALYALSHSDDDDDDIFAQHDDQDDCASIHGHAHADYASTASKSPDAPSALNAQNKAQLMPPASKPSKRHEVVDLLDSSSDSDNVAAVANSPRLPTTSNLQPDASKAKAQSTARSNVQSNAQSSKAAAPKTAQTQSNAQSIKASATTPNAAADPITADQLAAMEQSHRAAQLQTMLCSTDECDRDTALAFLQQLGQVPAAPFESRHRANGQTNVFELAQQRRGAGAQPNLHF